MKLHPRLFGSLVLASLAASSSAWAQEAPPPLPPPPAQAAPVAAEPEAKAPAVPSRRVVTPVRAEPVTLEPSAPSRPRAEASSSEPEPVDEAPRAPRVGGLRVNAGLKVAYVGTSGYDLFSSNNVLPQFSVDATYGFWTRGRLALAAGLGWDAGGSDDQLRQLETTLSTHRFTVPIEVRYAVKPWLWAVGKVAPGAAYLRGEVKDASAPGGELSGSGWAVTGDATVGAAFALPLGARLKGKEPARLLVMPEVGYMLSSAARIDAKANRADDQVLGTDETSRIGKVALSGLVWRASVGVAF